MESPKSSSGILCLGGLIFSQFRFDVIGHQTLINVATIDQLLFLLIV